MNCHTTKLHYLQPWGTVCDNYNWFTDVAASVICKEMEYNCAEYWNYGEQDYL